MLRYCIVYVILMSKAISGQRPSPHGGGQVRARGRRASGHRLSPAAARPCTRAPLRAHTHATRARDTAARRQLMASKQLNSYSKHTTHGISPSATGVSQQNLRSSVRLLSALAHRDGESAQQAAAMPATHTNTHSPVHPSTSHLTTAHLRPASWPQPLNTGRTHHSQHHPVQQASAAATRGTRQLAAAAVGPMQFAMLCYAMGTVLYVCHVLGPLPRSLSSRSAGRHTSPEKPGKATYYGHCRPGPRRAAHQPRKKSGMLSTHAQKPRNRQGRRPVPPHATARGHGVDGRRRPSTARKRRRESLENWQGSKVPSLGSTPQAHVKGRPASGLGPPTADSVT